MFGLYLIAFPMEILNMEMEFDNWHFFKCFAPIVKLLFITWYSTSRKTKRSIKGYNFDIFIRWYTPIRASGIMAKTNNLTTWRWWHKEERIDGYLSEEGYKKKYDGGQHTRMHSWLANYCTILQAVWFIWGQYYDSLQIRYKWLPDWLYNSILI